MTRYQSKKGKVKYMKSIYDEERTGNRSSWKNRKKQLKKQGLKPGEWHGLSKEGLRMKTVRKGMIIQNKSGGPQYKVLDIVGFGKDKKVKVFPVEMIGKQNSWRFEKYLKAIHLFEWVEG